MKRPLTMLLMLVGVLSSLVNLAAQTQPATDEFQARIQELRSLQSFSRHLIAGVIRDRETGKPIAGAYVGYDLWYEGTFGRHVGFLSPPSNAHKWQGDAAKTDASGRFVGLLQYASSRGYPSGLQLKILVTAEGYMPIRVETLVRHIDRHLGYGFDIEMERCVQLHVRIKDQAGSLLKKRKLHWLLLRKDEPFQRGQMLTDENGQVELELTYAKSLDGLALHLWDATMSARVVLKTATRMEKPNVAIGDLALHKTPAAALLKLHSPPQDLQTKNVGFRNIGCVHYPRFAKKFELVAVNLTTAPGAPIFKKWDGKPRQLTEPLVPGPFLAKAMLDVSSGSFLAFDAKRGCLDAGPCFGRWRGTLSAEGKVDVIFQPPAAHRFRDIDDTRVLKAHKKHVVKPAALSKPEFAAVKGQPLVRLPLEFLGGLKRVSLYLIKNGYVLPKKIRGVRVKNRVALVPAESLKLATHVLLVWKPLYRSPEEGVPQAFADGPLLFTLRQQEGEVIPKLEPAETVGRVTLRCFDDKGLPKEGVILRFRGERVSFRSVWRYGIMPAGHTPWGFALEATSGLPHAILMTNSRGLVHLRYVPCGKWTIELLYEQKSLGLRTITVTPTTTRIDFLLNE